MSQADDFAQKLEAVNDALVAAVESCDDAAWQATSADEGWSAAALAHHIAEDHVLISGVVTGIGAGGFEMPLTPDALDAMNATHAQEFAAVGKSEVIDLAKANCAIAVSALRAMNDDQFAQTAEFFGETMTAAEVTEAILIGHPQGHLESFKAATGQG